MSGWTPPYKIIQGSGQSLALTATTNGHFANAVGSQTRAVMISLAPQSSAAYALVTITPPNGGTGAAATASTDYLIKTSDPPCVIGCNPGEYVNVFSSAIGTAFLTELTH